ncbi:serine/threonine protein kinase [bacterium]|nr:serine/threonine protein kinase [bacterium]
MSLEDRFEIDSPLHVGQVATAYPALQKGLDRKVLLKVLHQHWVKDKELSERFLREGKAIARINHPNVVKVYECGSEDGIPYLALEWIDGDTLDDRLKSRGPLSQDEVKKIAVEILKGLTAVHARGLIHRDLKPDNILMGYDGRVVLADFSLTGFERKSGLTGHGAVIGTPSYMAPELVDGEQASPGSDLFGVGVILLEMLTGSNPFAAEDPLVSLDKIRNIDPPRLSELPQFDPALARMVDALLAKNPDDRPVNAEEALVVLEGGTHPVDITSEIAEVEDETLPGEDTNKGMQRRSVRWVWWFGSVVVAVIIMAVIFKVSMDSSQDSSVDPVEQIKPVSAYEDTVTIAPDRLSSVDPTGRTVPAQKDIIKESVSSGVAGTARLTIIVRPWANVTIDDSAVGITPLGTLKMKAGRHIIKFTHDYYPPARREIVLSDGAADTLAVDLSLESAQINIAAKPWGYLWVDGDSIGLLPRNEPVWVVPGEHRIEIYNPEFDKWQGKVDVKPGEKLGLRVDLRNGTMIAENN